MINDLVNVATLLGRVATFTFSLYVHMLLLVPLDGCAHCFIKRGCLETKVLLNGAGIDNLRFRILIKHLNKLMHERAKKAQRLDSQFGNCLNVDRLAQRFTNQLRHLALRDNRSNNGYMPGSAERFVTFSQERKTARNVSNITIAV